MTRADERRTVGRSSRVALAIVLLMRTVGDLQSDILLRKPTGSEGSGLPVPQEIKRWPAA